MSMKPTREDTGEIQNLYVASSGTRNSQNLRDASGSKGMAVNTTWKQSPTAIATPRNPGRPSMNPYGTKRMATTINRGSNNYSSRAGNITAQQTLTSHASKRRKVDYASSVPVASRQQGPRTAQDFRNPNKGSKHPPLAPEVINIDDYDEEDLGQLVMPSSDDLNIRDTHSAVAVRSNKPDLDIKRQKHHPFDDNKEALNVALDHSDHSEAVPDGPNTLQLRSQFSERGKQVSSDPIEDFPDTSEKLRPVPVGSVRKKVAEYEQLEMPHLDLRRPMKRSMNPKLVKKLGLCDPIVTSSSAFINGNKRAVGGTSEKKSKPANYLPLKEVYLGLKYFPDENDEEFRLQWEGDGHVLIKSGALGTNSRHTIDLLLDREVESIQCTEALSNAKLADPVIWLETVQLPKPRMRSDYGGCFKLGAGQGKGTVAIKFSSDHRDWDLSKYQKFVKWLKNAVKDHHTIDMAAARTIWESLSGSNREMVSRKTSRRREQINFEPTSKSTRSRKRPGSPIIEPLKQDSACSTPPTIDNNTTYTTNGHIVDDHQAALEIPDSPTKSHPTLGPSECVRSDVAGPSERLRRSSRHSGPQISQPSPPSDPDELILVYPPAATGAVNITNLDLSRLQPGEFLNDTLIEFGLKLWLKELEENNPELAKQIHVFSSFFYKKLNKKNLEEGYQSVRKWTSKVDLFEKKYIIVPINENLHWYLAIIYHPEHVLLPPLDPPQRVSARQRARTSSNKVASAEPSEQPKAINNPSNPPSAVVNDNVLDHQQHSPSDVQGELEVEQVLFDFKNSCSVTVQDSQGRSKTKAPLLNREQLAMHIDLNAAVAQSPSPFSSVEPDHMDIDELDPKTGVGTVREISPTVSDSESSRKHSTDRETLFSDVVNLHDIEEERTSTHILEPEDISGIVLEVKDGAQVTSGSTAVEPNSFYGNVPKQVKGIHNADSHLGTIPMDVDDDDVYGLTTANERPLTYIFTLDSLGSRHPQAISNLRQYLQLEAGDKKGCIETSKAKGATALVPAQPNYCDCGIYLLHFAQTFMKDPVHYCRIICTKKRNSTLKERQADWDDASVGGIREKLAARIEELSAEWKRERAAKEETKRKETLRGNGETEVVESSDDDVDIVEDITPVLEDGKGKTKGGKGAKASRIRG